MGSKSFYSYYRWPWNVEEDAERLAFVCHLKQLCYSAENTSRTGNVQSQLISFWIFFKFVWKQQSLLHYDRLRVLITFPFQFYKSTHGTEKGRELYQELIPSSCPSVVHNKTSGISKPTHRGEIDNFLHAHGVFQEAVFIVDASGSSEKCLSMSFLAVSTVTGHNLTQPWHVAHTNGINMLDCSSFK